jgi:uncharacterized protein
MAIDRRSVLLGAAALPFAAREFFVAACGLGAGQYGISAFDVRGTLLWTRAAPARGHGMCRAPDGSSLALFARRPGDFLLLLAAQTGAVLAQAEPFDGLQFNGHGVFSADGATLFATCTRLDDDSGWVGVHARAQGWRAVAAWPTGGSDPHEILRLGDTLIVANGGLPGGKTPADVREVETSLVSLDARDGALLSRAEPPAELSAISLRHMSVLDRTVYVAGQDQARGEGSRLLLAAWTGGALRYHQAPEMGGYCGSIVANGDLLCLTSPKAGRAYVLRPDTAEPHATVALEDVCGAAPEDSGHFMLTGGRGDLRRSDENSGPKVNNRRWDNHALRWRFIE